ncbi:toll/interleukin-1 receptor domain-containing protein [uncultured Chryseobacterium sp.]|uniref:toll/interleukin-1 receptor domain-containing protein n=1 Tax=uncultured Chryseobacterium sp. TaxID=259322 RepID=UPI0025DC9458|nr:toll/interleukin-1 receptor domain-containing protein [uncultured Chryseobacterium sp.]
MKNYLFELSYGNRVNEKDFINSILQNFDNQTLTGITMFVNNNIYNLEFLLLLYFEKDDKVFDVWLEQNFQQKKRVFNYTPTTITELLLENRYSMFSFSKIEDIEPFLTHSPNQFFLYNSRENYNKTWGGISRDSYPIIFLSHSSQDKKLVDEIFNELQKEEIEAWYDKYQIDFGDSITEKINSGLNNSDLGILCLSKNFLNSPWAKNEMNFFIQKRINSGKKKFICLNIDLTHDEIPPLLQDYRYVSLKNPNWINDLVRIIKKVDIK